INALWIGWVAGCTANAIALCWTVELFCNFASMPLWAALLTSLLLYVAQGLPFAAAAFSTVFLGRITVPIHLALPMSVTLAFSIIPAIFPWRPAVSALGFTTWVQMADLGGEALIDFILVLVGSFIFEAYRRKRRGLPYLKPLMVASICFALPVVYGVYRIDGIEEARRDARKVRVGIVQPNIGIDEKRETHLHYAQLQRLQEMSISLESRGAELIVWPETAYPFDFPRERKRDVEGARSIRVPQMQAPLIVGAITEQSHCVRYNSALTLDRFGAVLQVVDKVELLAFGEYVPLWDYLPGIERILDCPGLKAGDQLTPVHLLGISIGILNCYEDFVPGPFHKLLEASPELFINLTNDAWFGDTNEPWLHHHVARYRAIEGRRDLVRVVNSGVSGHISATGNTLFTTKTFERDARIAEAAILEIFSPFASLGEWLTAAIAFVMMAHWIRFRWLSRASVV
ncbi:MAG: apolipoprotein N-acyltransferase, partial [Myxococcota bacterium]